jgi:DNA-directed RNA polymerase subunit RPC12/RpoP
LKVKEWALPAEKTEQEIDEVAKRRLDDGDGVQCPRCGSEFVKRLPRAGFLEGRIYSFFGYFPWRCTKCLGSFMIKKRSVTTRRRELAPDAELG